MLLFCTEKDFEDALKTVSTTEKAKEIFVSVETRFCPSHWITKARNKYLELCEKEYASYQ